MPNTDAFKSAIEFALKHEHDLQSIQRIPAKSTRLPSQLQAFEEYEMLARRIKDLGRLDYLRELEMARTFADILHDKDYPEARQYHEMYVELLGWASKRILRHAVHCIKHLLGASPEVIQVFFNQIDPYLQYLSEADLDTFYRECREIGSSEQRRSHKSYESLPL